jgi:hypothetical protein
MEIKWPLNENELTGIKLLSRRSEVKHASYQQSWGIAPKNNIEGVFQKCTASKYAVSFIKRSYE